MRAYATAPKSFPKRAVEFIGEVLMGPDLELTVTIVFLLIVLIVVVSFEWKKRALLFCTDENDPELKC